MNIDKDQLPEDVFGSDEERSIEDLIREDEAAAQAEDNILNEEKRNGRNKKIVIGSISTLAVTGLIVSAFFFDPFNLNNGGQTVGEKDNKNVSQTSDGGGADPEYANLSDAEEKKIQAEQEKIAPTVKDDGSKGFYLEEGKEFPIEKADWQKTGYSAENIKEQRGEILYSTNGTELKSSSGTLPYEAAGYTSDDSKAFLDSGAINPDYSYWTAESFSVESSVILERLLNPTFGDWGVIQYPSYPGNKSYNPNTLRDIFTDNYLSENADQPYSSYIPVYADWNGDNYGGMDNLLETGPRWYGNIESADYEFVYDEGSSQYIVNMTAKVKYTAWAKDQTKLEKNGTLTIKFVANANNAGDSSHKVLIDDASLKVDE